MKLGRSLLLVALVALLLLAVSEIPPYGLGSIENEVTRHYMDLGVQETGALNLVASILVDYRAYDTLIETTVLFAALVAILLTLKRGDDHA